MTPSIPRTLFVARSNGGIAWYRVVLPATVLGADWIAVNGKPPKLDYVTGVTPRRLGLADFADYEVVVLQQPVGEEWLRAIRDLQARGTTVLFEIDDYLQAVRKIETHELSGHINREWLRQAELNMRIADGIICSTRVPGPPLPQVQRAAVGVPERDRPQALRLRAAAQWRAGHDRLGRRRRPHRLRAALAAGRRGGAAARPDVRFSPSAPRSRTSSSTSSAPSAAAASRSPRWRCTRRP